MTHRSIRLLPLTALAVLVGAAPALAQADSAAVDLRPHIGYLLQADALLGPEVDPDGFVLRNARLRIGGSASRSAGYFVQAELLRQPAVLDARLEVDLGDAVEVRAGLYKSPFGREFLMFRGVRPLPESPRAVDALVPGRQVGASVRVARGDAWVEAGLFNGNGGRTLVNDGDGLLAVARGEAVIPSPLGALRLGASGARGHDDAAPIPDIDPAFEGTRTVLGADAELTSDRVYVLAEALAARLDTADGDRQPWGAALTASVETLPHLRVVGRVDLFEPDPLPTLDAAPERTRIAAGLDFEPQEHVRLLAAYDFPASTPDSGTLRLRLQLALR